MSVIQHKDHFHGSDLEKIEALYHIPKDEIISFSANVNPLGISGRLRESIAEHVDAICSYPDREYTQLRRELADYTQSRPEQITVGNGTTELISLFIELLSPKRALILGPTYSEYEREVTLCGGSVRYFPLHAENDFRTDIDALCALIREAPDLLLLCNPNNPTSTCIPAADLRRILDVCKERNVFVIIDETYVEFVENPAKVTAIPLTNDYNNLLVLRGTSKFFAAPGLRLGYAVCGNNDLLIRAGTKKSPWMINSLAAVCAGSMFTDKDYIEKTRDLIRRERERMYEALRADSRFTPFMPAANFMLVRIEDPDLDSHILFDRCIKQRLMIRDCSTFPFLSDRYTRFCFLLPEQNDRLMKALME